MWNLFHAPSSGKAMQRFAREEISSINKGMAERSLCLEGGGGGKEGDREGGGEGGGGGEGERREGGGEGGGEREKGGRGG